MTGYVDSLDWEHATFLKLKILTLNMSAQMAKTTGRILHIHCKGCKWYMIWNQPSFVWAFLAVADFLIFISTHLIVVIKSKIQNEIWFDS